jgi:hypothetical protein
MASMMTMQIYQLVYDIFQEWLRWWPCRSIN